jgi:hypothetical protein
LVAGEIGEASDQESRRGDRENGDNGTLEERAGQLKRDEDSEYDIEDS